MTPVSIGLEARLSQARHQMHASTHHSHLLPQAQTRLPFIQAGFANLWSS
mgnify:CR=1 FL=1